LPIVAEQQDVLRLHAVEAHTRSSRRSTLRHVRAEHAAVGVHFVDHHVLQVLEELRPLGVVGQDRLVQHVGIADHDLAVQAHAWRASPGVSPSKVKAFTPSLPARLSSSSSATWSCASALVGNRYSARACFVIASATTGSV
jgi:hypothetical protein